MAIGNYKQILEKVSRASGISIPELERRVEAKRAKLSDLISKEGAAQIVAVELGVKFDKQKVKINELLIGMRKISVEGKIIRLFPVRTFKTKNSESKVTSFILADTTGNVRVVLWDTNHIALIEQGKLKEGSIVEIKNASVRDGDVREVHLGSQGSIEESDAKIENVVTQETMLSKKIPELQANNRAVIRAVVMQVFEPRFFLVCPECGVRVNQENDQYSCPKHGVVIPKERALLSLLADDGCSNIRAICFSESAKKLLGMQELEQFKNTEEFFKRKQELIGKEFFFSGRARHNKLFNNIEFIVQDLHEAKADEIIKELSKKS